MPSCSARIENAASTPPTLAALVDQTDQEVVADVLAGVRDEVTAGYSLKAGLDRHAGSFPDIYRASIAAGEKTGQLPRIMLQLADYLERREHLRRKVPLDACAVQLLLETTPRELLNDPYRAAARIKAAGGTLLSEPADRSWGVRMFQFTDLDGFKLGVSTPLAG